ncbi:hypothetical protein NitYY0826_C1077 [Nitratiruptor sp. YY08-26]|nr:hypothetical protein NitYY0813_C1075 [Nitratiruptor sp. YY08-13]BCD66137.1 hypothetical protein NitYY0826_C1077 [Nitratiruptor sp. YY08-26]
MRNILANIPPQIQRKICSKPQINFVARKQKRCISNGLDIN